MAEQILDRCVETSDGCWVFTGATTASGYGVVKRGGKARYTHRATYEFLRADIPAGLQIDHLCRNRKCVNPWHLEPVTLEVNIDRVVGTHCKRGHERTEGNTYRRPGGHRRGQCLPCLRLRARP